jgi:hypothetical protein
MTYWATLWYAGAVVMQLGYEGQTLNDCELLRKTMETDITQSYANPEKIDDFAMSMFPTNQFKVTCENKVLVIDEKYRKGE